MKRIVILSHPDEEFPARKYLIKALFPFWAQSGWEVVLRSVLEPPIDAELGFLHVDLSLVPEACVQGARQYRRMINGRVTDIRKRSVSRNLLSRSDDWAGEVLVKADLNCAGFAEHYLAARQRTQNKPLEATLRTLTRPQTAYRLYRSIREVPDLVWTDESLIVERFLPERDADGFWVRTWLFFGNQERSRRLGSAEPIVKDSNASQRTECEVPEALRAERERLGFDYGKFDYVLRDGRPILFDANKTPTAPSTAAADPGRYATFASGIEHWSST